MKPRLTVQPSAGSSCTGCVFNPPGMPGKCHGTPTTLKVGSCVGGGIDGIFTLTGASAAFTNSVHRLVGVHTVCDELKYALYLAKRALLKEVR